MVAEPFFALAIQLRPDGPSSYAVEMQLLPAHGAPAQLLARSRPSVGLPLAALLAESADPAAYGRRLSAALFADPAAREALGVARAQAAADGLPLHLSLDLSACGPAVHDLWWETLQDPEPGRVGLALSERLPFSRFLASDAPAPPRVRPDPARLAVVAVASPDDLADAGLAPIYASAELARARAALSPLRVAGLGRPEGPPCTAGRLLAALRDGPDILCLICHGSVVDGEAHLWLESEGGRAAPIAARELAAQLDALPYSAQPALVVLAACASGGAGDGAPPAITAGPLIAGNGVTAVVAVNGGLTLATNSAFLEAMLREALRDGQIDRAVAAARGAVRERPDWWAPVLWLRLPHGRLWAAPAAPAPRVAQAPAAGGRFSEERGLAALKHLLAERAPDGLAEVELLEARFERYRRDKRRFGPSEPLRQEWIQIVDSLNEIARERCGISFNDLCRGRLP